MTGGGMFATKATIRLIAILVYVIFGTSANVGAASGQPLPDFPPYSFSAIEGGTSNYRTENSRPDGTLKFDAHTVNSFRSFKISPSWGSIGLSVTYKCFYKAHGTVVASPTYSDGEPCPSAQIGDAQYIRAFTIDLDGPNKDKFSLSYRCWIALLGQHNVEDQGPHKPGAICGHNVGGAPDEWVSQLTISLTRN
jgi:hypothetical protein